MSSKRKAAAKPEPVSRLAIFTLIAMFLMLVLLNGIVAYMCIYDLNPQIGGWPILRVYFREFWIAFAAIGIIFFLPIALLNYRYFKDANAHRKVTWYAKICIPLCLLPGLVPLFANVMLKLMGGA
jgi:hypothetical protein